MGSEHALNPTGGVSFRRGLEEPASSFIARLRLGDLDEAPRADPHAGCCGGWGRKPPGYPIMCLFLAEKTHAGYSRRENTYRSSVKIETIRIHHLRPCGNEVLNEFFLVVILRINLGIGT